MSLAKEMMDGMYMMGQVNELMGQIPGETARSEERIAEREAKIAETKATASKVKELVSLLRRPENADKVLITNGELAKLLEYWLSDKDWLCWALDGLNQAETHVKNDLAEYTALQPMMDELRDLLKQIPDGLLSLDCSEGGK